MQTVIEVGKVARQKVDEEIEMKKGTKVTAVHLLAASLDDVVT